MKPDNLQCEVERGRMMKARVLDLVPAAAPGTPAMPRGRLLFVADICEEIFRGRKSAWWVRHRLAPDKKLKIGRDCAWYEQDIYAWLESQKGA